MERINRYLDGVVSDEKQVSDFLESHDAEIKDFFINLWGKYASESLTTPAESQSPTHEEAAEDTLSADSTDDTGDAMESAEPTNPTGQPNSNTQPQINMSTIFGSGEKPDKKRAQNDALAYQIRNKQIAFLNGKVNQQYAVDFDFETLGIPEISEVVFDGLDKIGLEYFPDEKTIKGLPTEPGDHKISMFFKIKGYEDRPMLEREVVFIINPDPRVLWSKNIPTLENIEYYKPDSDKAFIKVEPKVETKLLGLRREKIARKDMVAASQRGRSHAIEGKPRDDDFALHFDEETECYIMIVADGAGSAKYSRRGSRIACETAMNVCRGKLLMNKDAFLKHNKLESKNEVGKIWQDTISSAVFAAYKAIEKEAQEQQYAIKDFATTLILSICKKFEYGWFVAAWWVGDGGIGIYDKDTQYLKILGEPDGGEFAGQTRFLTMPNIIQQELYDRMKFEIVKDFTALILMTDGVTDPKFETDANLNQLEQWHALWDDLNGKNEDGMKVDFNDDNEQSAEQLLKWLDFWSKGNHDDRTIAILF